MLQPHLKDHTSCGRCQVFTVFAQCFVDAPLAAMKVMLLTHSLTWQPFFGWFHPFSTSQAPSAGMETVGAQPCSHDSRDSIQFNSIQWGSSLDVQSSSSGDCPPGRFSSPHRRSLEVTKWPSGSWSPPLTEALLPWLVVRFRWVSLVRWWRPLRSLEAPKHLEAAPSLRFTDEMTSCLVHALTCTVNCGTGVCLSKSCSCQLNWPEEASN